MRRKEASAALNGDIAGSSAGGCALPSDPRPSLMNSTGGRAPAVGSLCWSLHAESIVSGGDATIMLVWWASPARVPRPPDRDSSGDEARPSGGPSAFLGTGHDPSEPHRPYPPHVASGARR